jgi:hypothetical protein
VTRPSRLTRFFRWLWPNAGRPGVAVGTEGPHVVLKATEFRTLLTPENAESLARGVAEAADRARAFRIRAGGAS